jgi:uncharacterized protein (TIGR03118 family)
VDGAIFKGLALATNGGSSFLYAADFHRGRIVGLDDTFHVVHLAGSFEDPNLPDGYAPFNVVAIGRKLYVAYAVQDADREDELAGAGKGLIDVSTPPGTSCAGSSATARSTHRGAWPSRPAASVAWVVRSSSGTSVMATSMRTTPAAER